MTEKAYGIEFQQKEYIARTDGESGIISIGKAGDVFRLPLQRDDLDELAAFLQAVARRMDEIDREKEGAQ